MGKQDILDELKQAMVTCKADVIMAATKKAVDEGISGIEIIDGLADGMTEVGDQFERGKVFLPHVMMAANGMQAAVDTLDMGESGTAVKKIIINATVEGDVHDIGKSIVSTMLQSAGFEVHDLGRDVPVGKIIEAIKEYNADMVGLSALMTTTLNGQKDVIELLKANGMRDNIKVMVGGAPATTAWAEKIGADCYAENATEAVDEAKRLLL
ncbi:Methionine synthase [Methanimicrococcus sp. At1]|uniref:Methionine synthase n=1 Tax=Methanimicrococcus hacksteinii TaxID=3028293 RepID=A0ABU3VQQ8_9EURY|nr:B12-binding domain-containing protein [Methanimicrococcus sp. At1]MDV0445225.1 Methionine synthase [Methanimicrococcus sp. At1]